MKIKRLVRRLGLDRNPLRRRSDKIAVCLGALLLAGFLVGAPLMSAAAIGWASHTGAIRQAGEHNGLHVPAARIPVTPPRLAFVGGAFGYSRVLAGQTGLVERPRTGHLMLAREAIAALVATAALGIVLLCMARAGRSVLDRRRLAAWGTAWAAVGPLWTKRFRSRG